MRDAVNIQEVSQLGVDWIGLNFCPGSPQYVRQISSNAGIIPDYGSLDTVYIKDNTSQTSHQKPLLCGIFADDMPQNIVTRVVNFHLDIVRLDGEESPVMIDNLRRTLDPDIHAGIKIMKSFTVSSQDDLKICKEYVGHADYFLFKLETPFDKSLFSEYKEDIPFLLSDNTIITEAESVKSLSCPQFLGVSIDCGFETESGLKDVESLKRFLEKLINR